jgi:GNAT superfamily N-acetyltransferase
MSRVEVRVAGPDDLATMVAVLGQGRFFADRLARQEAGRGLLLVALVDGRPVGDVYLWLEPAEEPEVRRYLPGVPLLGHLEVLPELRSHGIGTEIMRVAEELLRRGGHQRVALGVDMDNHRAAELYHRLGYTHWGYAPADTSQEVFHADGRVERVPEKCYILVKDLSR